MTFQDAAGFLVFMASLSCAAIWVAWHKALAARRHLLAGVVDALLIGFGGVITIGYTHDPTMLLYAMAGGAVGTTLTSWGTK